MSEKILARNSNNRLCNNPASQPIRHYMKNLIKTIILFYAIFAISTGLYAQQDLTTKNKKAKAAFEKGVEMFNLLFFNQAEDEFKRAIGHDSKFIEAYIVLSEVLQTQEKHTEAIGYLEKAISLNPDFYPLIHFYLGESYMKIGHYKEAKKVLETFLIYNTSYHASNANAKKYIKNCDFAIIAKESPVPFEPKNLGENINTINAEYSPVLTADGQTLIFTRKQPRTNPEHLIYGKEYEDFYISFLEDGKWTEAVNLGEPINTLRNEGAQSITADGRHLYFTACGRPDGFGSCDIYYSFRIGNQWSQPQNLGPIINSNKWDSQPSISPDGQTLFFTSGRNGNRGHMDIWFSEKNDEGHWTTPENMGDIINTSGREMSPFIHPDNQTLYFASDGHPGMGGLDLFFTKKDENGEWGNPINLGYPINTHADEMSLFVSSSGKEAYFASDLLGGFGDMDIYFFELYEEVRPQPITYMKGIVYDSETKQRLEADIELIELSTNETIVKSKSDSQFGEFLVVIPLEKNIGLNVSKDGYLFFSENFQYTDVRESVDPFIRDINLKKIKRGEIVVLKNIFFETAKFDLLPESVSELQRLLELLKKNPTLKIEISGHTDSIGSYAYNLELSKNRARSVYNYLIENEIDKSRLSYNGYADTQAIDTNETEEGRANNRRTEFKVID
jgi:outer membrane protein OmpA-like peptidoglycan-associated protein